MANTEFKLNEERRKDSALKVEKSSVDVYSTPSINYITFPLRGQKQLRPILF